MVAIFLLGEIKDEGQGIATLPLVLLLSEY